MCHFTRGEWEIFIEEWNGRYYYVYFYHSECAAGAIYYTMNKHSFRWYETDQCKICYKKIDSEIIKFTRMLVIADSFNAKVRI